MAFPLPSPQPGRQFPLWDHWKHGHGCCCRLSWTQAFTPRSSVMLGFALYLAGPGSFLGGETAHWGQGEAKGPYSFPGVVRTCCSELGRLRR